MIKAKIIIGKETFKKPRLIKIKTQKIDKIKDPTLPDIVLFGLIFVNFLPLNIFPNINPPTSEKIQINKTKSKNDFV